MIPLLSTFITGFWPWPRFSGPAGGGAGAGGAFTTTVNIPDFVASAVLVAVTTTFVLVVTVGAVNKPACVIDVPPETDQFTLCGAPAGKTAAEHWLVVPEFTGVTQLMLREATAGGGGGVKPTAAVPLTESCTLVAVTVIGVAALTIGAVSTPEEEIVPPDTDQFTAILKLPVPVTITVHASDAPEATGVAQVGTTEVTFEGGVGGGGCRVWELIPPAQPEGSNARSKVSLVFLISTNLSARCHSLNVARRLPDPTEFSREENSSST